MGMTVIPVNGKFYENYQFTNLTKNMKFTLKCSERLMYKLFLMIETNYHDI